MSFVTNAMALPEQKHSAAATLHHLIDTNAVSDIFFSQKNVDILHEAIRYLVFKYSSCRHVISKQSDEELQVIMKSTYLEHAKNLPFNVLSQVRELNALVLDFCVPRILREINMYMKFKSELLRNPVPNTRPEYISSKGTKTLITR